MNYNQHLKTMSKEEFFEKISGAFTSKDTWKVFLCEDKASNFEIYVSLAPVSEEANEHRFDFALYNGDMVVVETPPLYNLKEIKETLSNFSDSRTVIWQSYSKGF